MNANPMKLIIEKIQRCLNHVFLLDQLKSYQGGKTSQKDGFVVFVTWKEMLGNALIDTASLQTKKVEQLHKVSSPCLDVHQVKKEELE